MLAAEAPHQSFLTGSRPAEVFEVPPEFWQHRTIEIAILPLPLKRAVYKNIFRLQLDVMEWPES